MNNETKKRIAAGAVDRVAFCTIPDPVAVPVWPGVHPRAYFSGVLPVRGGDPLGAVAVVEDRDDAAGVEPWVIRGRFWRTATLADVIGWAADRGAVAFEKCGRNVFFTLRVGADRVPVRYHVRRVPASDVVGFDFYGLRSLAGAWRRSRCAADLFKSLNIF